VATAAIVLAGCGGAQPADRAGGDTVVLRLATIEGEVNGNGQAVGPPTFVEQLTKVSQGRLQVDVAFEYEIGRGADAESRLVEAIAAGDLDGGWPSTRAFADAGIRGLEAVEAPMTLSNSAAVGALVTGPAAATALGLLQDSGVKGLALSASTLRRPFAADEPLLGPDDWASQPVRVYNSPVQADTVTALGGKPVNLGFTWVDEVLAGRLRGAEFDVAQYAYNGFSTEAGAVTANVVLWPKVYVLALSQKRFDSLNDQQQEWVQQAATRAAEASVEDALADDARAEDLCGRGVRFVPAGPEQLAAMRAALAPVVDGLAADPVTAPLMEQVLDIAREHPDVESVDVPAECRTVNLTGAEPSAAPSIPAETAAIPDGIYRVELSAAEVAAAGLDNGQGHSGTWTITIKDGTYVVTCRPVDRPGRDCGNTSYDGPLDAGQLRGSGQTVTFVWDGEMMVALTGCDLSVVAPAHGACYPQPPITLKWSLDGDELRFRQIGGGEPYASTLKPYRKIG
jgi:TRAP-type C4-dicarboxylate transport system substrate-binding protein